MCAKVVLSPSPIRPLHPFLWLAAATPRLYKKYQPPLRVPVLATPDPITDPTVSQKRERHNLVLLSAPTSVFPLPLLPPSGSWTDRLPGLLIHQGNHDVAEQRLPSPRTLIRPNLPLCLDRQARPCPRSDICTPISRPRINTSDLLIPRLTRLLHSNTHRSKALSDIRPNPLTRIRPGDYRRSRSRIRTSTPLLRQRRGANGRHSVALVSKISQTQL